MSLKFRIKPSELHYPYLVVRLMSTIYQHVEIAFRTSRDEFSHQCLEVVCSTPFKPDGTLTDIARNNLVDEVKLRVAKERFRMCIVLEPEHSIFIELDGAVNELASQPASNLLGNDLEVYDDGRMPTRESVTAPFSGEVAYEVSSLPVDPAEIVTRQIEMLLSVDEDDGPIH